MLSLSFLSDIQADDLSQYFKIIMSKKITIYYGGSQDDVHGNLFLIEMLPNIKTWPVAADDAMITATTIVTVKLSTEIGIKMTPKSVFKTFKGYTSRYIKNFTKFKDRKQRSDKPVLVKIGKPSVKKLLINTNILLISMVYFVFRCTRISFIVLLYLY